MSIMIEKNKKIESVMAVFNDYWKPHNHIEILFSDKFGYILIKRESDFNKELLETISIKKAEQLLKLLIEQMEMDFMLEKNEDCWTVPIEYQKELTERVQTYLEKLPEYKQFHYTLKQ